VPLKVGWQRWPRFTALGLFAAVASVAADPPVLRAEEGTPTLEELRQELQTLKAVMLDLMQRIETVERAGDDGLTEVAPASVGATPEPGVPAPVEGDPGAGEAGTSPPLVAGGFDIEEEELDRALERTLVQTGALLLPFGKAEIAPDFTYTRRAERTPGVMIINDATLPAEVTRRRDELTGRMSLRFGLPLDAQIELGLPYRFVDQSTVTRSVLGQRTVLDQSGHGLGDLRVGLAKTVFRERDWRPDLVARIIWDSNTGTQVDNDVALSDGFHRVTAAATALKRQDPLVFVGTVLYSTAFEEHDIDPGDELGFSIGTVLAASPLTSLRLTLDQRFAGETAIDGRTIAGSDQVVGIFSLGASSVIGNGVLLDVSAGIGLTDDSPDYSVTIALPIRFDVPFLR
jgi:hypothetical protein